MEPFFDGGLFELLIAIGIGYSLNFIFKIRFLLILYSIVSVAIPILPLFITTREILIWSAGLSIFNSVLLVILLWQQRFSTPNNPLFEIDKYSAKLFKKKA